MSEHLHQMEMKPALATTLRMLVAFGACWLLGFLGSRLASQFTWSGYLFLLTPLLLGILGMLTVGSRSKHPLLNGLCTNSFAWLGIWLSVLEWESSQPQTITDCFHADPPCGPSTVPFSELDLFLFLIIFVIGLCFLIVSTLITKSALETRWRG